jgi:transposase
MTPFCAANLERAVRHVTQGMSVPDAAAREDVEEGALLHEIQRRGGLKALRPRLTDWTERKESAKTEEALRLIRLGASVRDASQGSGATLSAIRSALARRGGMMVFMERVKHGK